MRKFTNNRNNTEARLRKQLKEAEQKMVDDWNARFAVGQPVEVKRDNGDILVTKTRSNASMLGGHSPVIWVEGISACYSLNRVTPLKEEKL